MKTLTERIFDMNIIKTGREARELIISGRVSVDGCMVTNEEYQVSDTEEVVVKPVKKDSTMTNKYLLRFFARKKGALGLTDHYERTIKAPSIEDARLKLYDEFDHISGGLEWKQVTGEKDGKE